MDNITFSQGKLNGPERKSLIQAVQSQMQQAALQAIKPILSSFLEEELNLKLARPRYRPGQVGAASREIDWQGGNCGCQDANHFTRDGHYQRSLETGWGHLSGLKVPMLECQVCQHDVVAQWAIVEKFQRFWLDLDQRVLFGAGLC